MKNQQTDMEAQVQRILGNDNEAVEQKRLADNQRKMFLVAEGIERKLKKSLKPKGFFNIPELLDERRLEYLIPNGAFGVYPAFDKVLVWQLSTKKSNTYAEGGIIQMPDNVIAAKRITAPRGVIVSAGLKAMDALYSTGIEVGHIVRFKKLAPFCMPIEEIDGHELTVMEVRDGDIAGSEDMAQQIHSKRGKIVNVGKDKNMYDFRFELDGSASGQKTQEYYDASY